MTARDWAVGLAVAAALACGAPRPPPAPVPAPAVEVDAGPPPPTFGCRGGVDVSTDLLHDIDGGPPPGACEACGSLSCALRPADGGWQRTCYAPGICG